MAAENLVPVTLELGGKTPAILLEDSVEPAAVEHIVGIKMIKNGQMCNTVDHCLVPRRPGRSVRRAGGGMGGRRGARLLARLRTAPA